MSTFLAAFLGAIAAIGVSAAVAAMVATVRRHNRALAEIRKVSDSYGMPSPWWKRWYQPTEEWRR